MRIGYLWEVKQRDADATRYRDLASSAVAEPTDLLRRHLKADSAILEERIAQSNAFGQPLLRQLILDHYAAGHALDAHVTNGASGAIWLVCHALLRPGDEVVIETPVYEPLLAVPEHIGARIVRLPRRHDAAYQLDIDQLLSLVSPATRLIILSNLHNPSAAELSGDLLQEFASQLRQAKRDVVIVMDETFLEHSPGRIPAATLDAMFLSINTLSKVYGLSLLRCGWVLGRHDLVEAVRRSWVLVENSGSRLTEAISSIVLERLDEYWQFGHTLAATNRKITHDALAPLIASGKLHVTIPEFGTMWFPRIANVPDTRELVAVLRERHHILVASGHHFGDPQAIRIGFGGHTKELQDALRDLTRTIEGWV